MKVWTFYSFKGGVGRSLAVAHVALALANQGKHVVCMDFDLEAPGLDRYLPPTEKRPGTLDIFDAWQSAEQDPNLDDFAAPVKLAALRRGSIRLVGSGHHAPDYSSRLSGLQWEHMPDMGQFLTWLRQRLTGWDGVDHVLLDSRTGMTDLASLCTFHLPDCLIIIFALNHQGLEGSRLVAEAVQRRRSVEEGPRRVLFLPARVDTTDGEKQQEWLDRARNQLAGLGEFPNGLLIPYDRTYAYGELLVAPEDAADWPIVQSYRRVASTILEEELAEIDVEVDSFPRRRAQLARVRTLQQHWKELQERLAAGPDPDDVAHVLGELRQMQQELAGITAGLETGVLQRWDGWSGGASPGTLRECTIFSERLEAAIQRADRARLHHLESEQEKIEAEVGALEDRDRQELERIVDLVDPAEREHRLQTFHEDLRRSRIDVKIRSGALCREDVEGLYADRADGVLDQHLDVALERNEEPTALLAILKLRAPGLEDVAPRHWNAWSKVWKLDGAFAAVGEQLWLAAWRQALRTGTAVGDGEEERLALLELPDTEMQRLAASLAAALDTAEVAELLRLRPILASRTDDLLLTEAVQRMPSGRRRARLAAWIALDQREESLKGVALEDWAAAGGAADVATCLSDLPAKIAAPVALALFRVGEFSAFQQFVRRNSAAVAEILARKDTDVLSLLALCTPDLLQHEARQHYDWVKKELGPPPWVRTGDLEVERLYQHLEDLLKKKFAGSWKGWGSRWDEAIQQWWRDHLGALVDGGERPPTTSQLTVELESADPPLAKNPPEGGLLTAFRSLHEDRLEALDGLRKRCPQGGTAKVQQVRNWIAKKPDFWRQVAKDLSAGLRAADPRLGSSANENTLLLLIAGDLHWKDRVEQLFGQGRYDEARRVHLATPPAEPRAALDEWLLNRRQELRGEVDNVEVWLGEHRADLQDMTAKLDTAIAQARITLAFDPEDSDELEATFRRAEDANRALQESARQAKERLSQRREAERALREQLLGQIDTRLKELLDSDDDRVFAAAQKHQRALRGLRPSASASTLQKFLGSLEYVLAGEPVEDAPLALPPSPSTELPSPLPSSATPDPCPPYDPLQLAEPLREQVGKPDGRADHEPWGWRKNDDFDSLPYSSRLFAAARDRLLRADGPPGMGGAPLFFHAWWSERARADSSAHSSLRRDSAAWGLLLSMIVPFEEEQAREILEPKNLAQLCGLPVGDLPLGRALDLGVLPTLGAFLSRAGPAAPTFCRDYLRDWLQKNKAAQLEFVAGTAEGLGQESSSQTAWELIRVLADPSLPALKNPRDALSEAAALLKNSNENMALELVRDRVNLLRQPRPESAAHDLSWLVTDVDYGRVVSSLSVPEEAPSVPGVEARLLIAGRPPLSRAVRLVQRGDATEVVWGVSPVPGSANPLEIRFETRLAGTAQLLRTLRGTAAPTLPGPPAPLPASPYIVGLPVDEAGRLYGRDEDMKKIRSALIGAQQDNAVMVLGDRRIGKTSILKTLIGDPDLKRRYGIVVYHDHQRLPPQLSPADYYRTLLRAVERETRLLLPTLVDEERLAQAPHEAFHEAMRQVDDTLGRRNQRMLFVIDELEWLFQNFSVPSASDNYHPVVAATLRSVIQDMRRIAFVLAGVSDVLSQHTRGPAQRLFRMAVEVKLWPLAEPFAAAALESPVRHVLRYTAPALELILRLTGRHPYLLQRVGHLLYEHCGKKSQRVISREDVEWVIDRQLARDRSIFGFLLDVVPAATRPLVDHVAQLQSENRYVPLPLLAQELGRDEAVVTTALDEIREQLGSVFELRQRGVRINVPLFARHLRYLARGSFSLVRPRR